MTEGGVGINVIQLNEILPLNYIFSAPNMRRSQQFFCRKNKQFPVQFTNSEHAAFENT